MTARGSEDSAGTPSVDEIIFVGSGGGRMTTVTQLRATGGLWITLDGMNLAVDPGPGALVHYRSQKLGLDPARLDAVILTHKHLDHSGDVNAVIEAMTTGGTRKRGAVFAPRDAYENDPVILRYVRDYPQETRVLEPEGRYTIGAVAVETPLRLLHPGGDLWASIPGVAVHGEPDRLHRLLSGSGAGVSGDVLILNVVYKDPRDAVHLAVPDARRLIDALRPRLAVLTHFGMTMIRANPRKLADSLSRETGVRVLAARDGWRLRLNQTLS